ncbi:signal recognition particle subunit SRP72 [Tanacetum coccineum]|uniref:Signal recognition particle subunit SRP72 n=1 Tax=Tanacetum coccineum TaxID=301880 RepID=A0ABQ4ZLN4_9ASTR
MQTKIELTLEQTQQGVSDEVLSDTKVFTMTMKILPEPTSNKQCGRLEIAPAIILSVYGSSTSAAVIDKRNIQFRHNQTILLQSTNNMPPKAKPKSKASTGPAPPPVAVEDLFTSLNGHIQRSEYHQAVKLADQVLAVVPGDEDAIRCKVVALIMADNFDDAIHEIDVFAHSIDFGFFKVYDNNQIRTVYKVRN